MIKKFKQFLMRIKVELNALYIAIRDPRTPWIAKAVAGFVVAYALSPIDLIPDFVPLLGQLDDLLIVHLGVWLVIKLIPKDLMEEFRATSALHPSPTIIWIGAGMVVFIWVVVAFFLGWWIVTHPMWQSIMSHLAGMR